MATRRTTAAAFLVLGLIAGLLMSGMLNTPAPDVKANDVIGLTAQAGAAAAAASPKANAQKLAELREFAGKLETLFQTVADEVSPAVVLIEAEKTIHARVQDPFQDFFRGSPFDGMDRFFGNPNQGQGQERTFKQRGLGSGFILDADGRILTNNHVVDGADKLKVQLTDGREFDAEIVGTDPKTDLAVIRIKGNMKDLPTVPLGDSDDVKVGQWVLAVGNPFGLSHTVSAGIVSATGRRIGAADYESMIQTDAAINAGNSGGPLVNLYGEVIGINAAIVGPTNLGIGFAIPINMAKGVLPDLIAGRKVVRGHLGVAISPVKPDVAEAFGYEGKGGAIVQEVTPDSPADRAGIRDGDIITEFDGQAVKDSNDLQQRVMSTEPGKTVTLKVWRDHSERTVRVKLGNLAETGDWLGLTVQTLTKDMAQQAGRADIQGVVVTNVANDSIVSSDIQAGDVILSIDQTPVQTAQKYEEVIGKVKPGQTVPVRIYSPQTGFAHYIAVRRPTE